MKLQSVAAVQGHEWVRQGFRVFVKHPVGFAGLFATFLLIVFLLAALPFIGLPLLLTVMPLASLGFMIATQRALEGRFPMPRAFIDPLRTTRAQRIAFLKLGLIYAAATLAILSVSDAVSGGALDALVQAQSTGAASQADIAAKASDPRLQLSLLVRIGLLAMLSVPFWHAPALVHWGQQSAGKSLFFSTVALWRNKGAFLLYGLSWFGVFMLFMVVATLLMALLGRAQLVTLLVMPATMIFMTAFYASVYFTFTDCFLPDDEVPASEPELTS